MSETAFIHSPEFRFRRFLNWFPLGLAYAFLYMGRYNLTVAKTALGDVMTKEDFGAIFAVGTLVYGLAFLVNGPLTDRIGGKKAILAALFGAAVSNVVMALYVSRLGDADSPDGATMRTAFSFLYAVNMYFQSFGAVAIVKVNAHWFHVRERGGFSGIFGTMISSGIFLAFTVNGWILDALQGTGPGRAAATQWVFWAPAAALTVMFFVELFLLRDRPSQAGHADFDTGDASSGEADAALSTRELFKRIFTNPIILTVAFIEFCTGVLRQAVMQWYPIYAKEVLALPDTHFLRYGENWLERWPVIVTCFAVAAAFFLLARRSTRRRGWYYASGGLVFLAPFILAGWGGLLMVAGVIGGNVAGWVSDLFFQSRRAPASGGLYMVLTVAAVAMIFTLGGTTPIVGWAGSPNAPLADASATDRLRVGDEILSVAGTQKPEGWPEVQRAIACIPAACMGGAKFDTSRCLCSMKAKSPYEGPTPTARPIDVRVRRDGREMLLSLPDTGVGMRAGDHRTIRAGPKLTMNPLWLGVVVFIISLCVIGTHGVLSGTATMDFGGRRGAATAVGVIDGFVYLGTAVQAFALGQLTSASWSYWPWFMLPFAVVGVLLTLRIWNAKPQGRGGH
jgi:sugar phosphate permease